MIEYCLYILVSFLVSMLLGLGLIPLVVSFCKVKRIYDLPNERKVHKVFVPRLGGVCFIPCVVISFMNSAKAIKIIDIQSGQRKNGCSKYLNQEFCPWRHPYNIIYYTSNIYRQQADRKITSPMKQQTGNKLNPQKDIGFWHLKHNILTLP